MINPDSLIVWDFIIRHGYTPSSMNKWMVILMSDSPAEQMDGNDSFNGYGLGVNLNSNDDSLRLYTFQEGKPVSSLSAGINYETDAGTESYHFVISRDALKNWTITGSRTGSAIKMLKQMRVDDGILFEPCYFGIRYSYSSTRDMLLWFDDLRIDATFIADTIEPFISGSRVLSDETVKIIFSEELDPGSVHKEKISLIPGNTSPDSIIISGNEVTIFFYPGLTRDESYMIKIDSISDMEGNMAENLILEFTWHEAQIYDIIISEIMADPQPEVYLPVSEYIELFNRSEYSIDLDSFKIITGSKKWILPYFTLDPGQYLVVTNQDGQTAFKMKNAISLFSSSAVITNEGQIISIYDKKENVISAVEFDKSWYHDNYKSEGGWSLERIDNENICGETENWRASEDASGGTPGRINSVAETNPDNESPRPDKIIFNSSNRIELCFSESMNPYTFSDRSIFMTEDHEYYPDSILPSEPLFKSVTISYPENMKDGVIYSMRLPESISDCSGNFLISNKIRFGIPDECNYLDVIITEILWDPVTGCPEFIELYNLSGKVLELSDLRILVQGDGFVEDKIATPGPLLFFPYEYIVLTRDAKSLRDYFDCRFPERIIESYDLPLLSNEGACIKILNKSLQMIDEFCYKPADHFALINDQTGVSLERIRIDKKTGNQSDWHSSSSLSGFGTPGYKNSQNVEDELLKPDFKINPKIFSPDNDGRDDIMLFTYLFDKEGYSGNVCIFDPVGRIIKYLARNELFGTEGYLQWDGRDESGRLSRMGIYLIYMEAFHKSGKVKKYKGTVVLAKRIR